MLDMYSSPQGEGKKEKEILQRVNFVVARVDVELLCCAQPVSAAMDSRRFLVLAFQHYSADVV